MIDILFIHPNASQKIYQDLSKEFSAIEPPVWAGLLASHCLKEGFSAEILDCEAHSLDDEAAVEAIELMSPKIACFVVYGQQPNASTQNMEGAISLCEKVKKNTKIQTLFVGGHVAALSHKILYEHQCIDMACQNEGVYTISNLLRAKDLRKVDGLVYRENGCVFINTPSQIVPKERLAYDLPGIPWDRLPMSKYRTSLWHSYSNNTERQPFASLYTSLGCPYKCHFCMINIINRQKNRTADESAVFRYWDPRHTIKEFDRLADLGIKNVKIADEMFVLNPNHFLGLCNLIILKGHKFNIWCYARVDTVKEEYLSTLKKAGVNWLALGIESGSKHVRNTATKGRFSDTDILDTVGKIRNHDINVIGNYIFGLPEDDEVSMEMTLDLAKELNTEEVNFYCAMAYPGSPLYKEAKDKKWRLPSSYSGYSQHSEDTHPLRTKHLTAEEVLAFRDKAWMEYHSRKEYLEMIRGKFGEKAYNKVKDSLDIKLKRSLLCQ